MLAAVIYISDASGNRVNIQRDLICQSDASVKRFGRLSRCLIHCAKLVNRINERKFSGTEIYIQLTEIL